MGDIVRLILLLTVVREQAGDFQLRLIGQMTQPSCKDIVMGDIV